MSELKERRQRIMKNIKNMTSVQKELYEELYNWIDLMSNELSRNVFGFDEDIYAKIEVKEICLDRALGKISFIEALKKFIDLDLIGSYNGEFLIPYKNVRS